MQLFRTGVSRDRGKRLSGNASLFTGRMQQGCACRRALDKSSLLQIHVRYYTQLCVCSELTFFSLLRPFMCFKSHGSGNYSRLCWPHTFSGSTHLHFLIRLVFHLCELHVCIARDTHVVTFIYSSPVLVNCSKNKGIVIR